MNENPPQIVQFADGQYGLRRLKTHRTDVYEFKDLRADREYWWGMDTKYFIKDCRGEKQIVEQMYYFVTDEGTPVSLSNPLEEPLVKEDIGLVKKIVRFLFL